MLNHTAARGTFWEAPEWQGELFDCCSWKGMSKIFGEWLKSRRQKLCKLCLAGDRSEASVAILRASGWFSLDRPWQSSRKSSSPEVSHFSQSLLARRRLWQIKFPPNHCRIKACYFWLFEVFLFSTRLIFRLQPPVKRNEGDVCSNATFTHNGSRKVKDFYISIIK